MSSSAALEVASVFAFSHSKDFSTEDPLKIAKLAQRAERDFVGVNCGLMDQFISAAGTEGAALRIDCRAMEYEPIAIPEKLAVIVGDTKLSRSLAGSAYNQRRSECEEALRGVKANLQIDFQVEEMRDVNAAVVKASQSFLPDSLFRRLRHVASENQRVDAAVDAFRAQDFDFLGRLLNESHASLRDDYEVSSDGLDRITEAMRSANGCYGARLTGAGFGGCAIAIVDENKADGYIEELDRAFGSTEFSPEFFRVKPVAGGSIAPLETLES